MSGFIRGWLRNYVISYGLLAVFVTLLGLMILMLRGDTFTVPKLF